MKESIDMAKSGRHGGSVTEAGMRGTKVVTPYPLDTSDHKFEGEMGKELKVAASGAAGGYSASAKK
jgi:hypothetical protein